MNLNVDMSAYTTGLQYSRIKRDQCNVCIFPYHFLLSYQQIFKKNMMNRLVEEKHADCASASLTRSRVLDESNVP